MRFRIIQNARQAMPSLKLQEFRGEAFLVGTLAALVFLLLCMPLVPGALSLGIKEKLGHFSSTFGMGLNAAVATAVLHLMLQHFPRCFTLGR